MVSFPSSLVGFIIVPSLHALVFIQKTFCDLFLLGFFLYYFLGMVREKRRGRVNSPVAH